MLKRDAQEQAPSKNSSNIRAKAETRPPLSDRFTQLLFSITHYSRLLEINNIYNSDSQI